MNKGPKGSTPGQISRSASAEKLDHESPIEPSYASILPSSSNRGLHHGDNYDDPEKGLSNDGQRRLSGNLPRSCPVPQIYGADVCVQSEDRDLFPLPHLQQTKSAGAVSLDAEGNTYPEGGAEAWLVVLGSFCGMMCVFGLMNSIGVFQTYVAEHQLKGYNESTIGWIFSLYVFLSFFCGLQIGPIFDAKGPKLLMLSGGVLVIVGMMLLGLCTKYWHFILTFGLVSGVGTALVFTPSIAAIGHFFLVKRGAATGIAAAGGSLGGVIFPLMLQQLFPRVGFAWATRILGFLFIFLCAVSVLLTKSRLPPKKDQSVMPDLLIFKDLPFAFATAGVYFMEWGLFIPVAYISSFATTSIENGDTLSYTLIAVLNAGSCIGRFVPGFIADRVGRFNFMTVALFLCGLVTIVFFLPASILPAATSPDHDGTSSGTLTGLTLTFAFLFGVMSGSNISLTPVCVGQLCDTGSYGRFYATCYTVVSFGTLTGIPIAGALVKACGGRYWGLVIFTGVCYALSTAAFAVSRWLKVGPKLTVRF